MLTAGRAAGGYRKRYESTAKLPITATTTATIQKSSMLFQWEMGLLNPVLENCSCFPKALKAHKTIKKVVLTQP
jgi:hypothetical protein